MCLCLQFGLCDAVAAQYHLVQEKIILIDKHLSTNGMVATQPYVRLLCNRRVEKPGFTISAQKFGECGRIAMFLAKRMGFFML
jgi:hypothetical protein